MRFSSLAFAAGIPSALAQYKGFNYGSTDTAGAPYTQADFTSLFTNAANLAGAPGFTSARLYTMIQAGTANDITQAIPAAVATNTGLLLGLWASAGTAGFNNELIALGNAIAAYPTLKIAGISVGSEDLYRISPQATQAGSTNPGAEPADLVGYISQVRAKIAGTAWSSAQVGHVDTWTAFANTTNDVVASACDFVGIDAYPYFQTVDANTIDNGLPLFQTALNSITAAAKSKNVWITETGWPVSGPTDNQAVPGLSQAKQYWDQVGCDFLFGKYNTWWYTFDDAGSAPSFGVSAGGTTPLFDLTCSSSSTTTSSTAATTATSLSTSTTATTLSTVVSNGASTITSTPTSSGAAGSSVSSGAAGSSVSSGAASASASSGTASAPAPQPPASSGSAVAATQTSTAVVTAPCSSDITITVTQTAASAAAPSSTSKSCPANLNGDYQYPHLIVPVSTASPNTAYGTSYFGTVNSTVSSIFNFDIPASYAGKTCSLVFFLPNQADLVTSSYTFNNQGGIESDVLATVATQQTSFANQGAVAVANGNIPSVKADNAYVISSDSCPGGQAVSFRLSATNGLDLTWFQDYNQPPVGLYVIAC